MIAVRSAFGGEWIISDTSEVVSKVQSDIAANPTHRIVILPGKNIDQGWHARKGGGQPH